MNQAAAKKIPEEQSGPARRRREAAGPMTHALLTQMALMGAARGTSGDECYGDSRPYRGNRLMAAYGESAAGRAGSACGGSRRLVHADREVTSLRREWLWRSSEVVTRRT